MKYLKLLSILVCVSLIGFFGTNILLNKEARVVKTHSINMFDLKNSELLVGWADNVFVGTVNLKSKETKDEISPLSIYEVKVEENIKGNLEKIVNVSHRVAYDPDRKVLYKFDGAEYLKEGKKYLFVSRYDSKTDTHHIVPVEGDILLDTPEKEKELKEKFIKAEGNQKDYKDYLPKS